MKLVKIHKVLSFKQSNFLKKCVHLNTNKRKECPDEFSRGLYKLMINCIYGKSVENIRKKINVKLVNNKKDIRKLLIDQKIIDKNFIAVHCSKKVLTLNNPISL